MIIFTKDRQKWLLTANKNLLMDDKFFSIDEISKYLNIPKSTIYKLSQKKKLPSSKIGKQLRFRKSSIETWLSEQENESNIIINPDFKHPAIKNILLVDDDKLVLKTITRFLNKQGHNVEFAESGEEAIKKIEKSDFDLIIIDIRMPGIDGIETIKRFRNYYNKHNKPHIPEIVITGYMDTAAEKEATRLGITDYLYKPFAISDLIRAVKEKVK